MVDVTEPITVALVGDQWAMVCAALEYVGSAHGDPRMLVAEGQIMEQVLAAIDA